MSNANQVKAGDGVAGDEQLLLEKYILMQLEK